MSDWQPIETYEKVGDKTKPILVYFPGWGVEKVQREFAGIDTYVFGDRRVVAIKYDWLDRTKGPHHPPTHWMPLPAPPAEQETL